MFCTKLQVFEKFQIRLQDETFFQSSEHVNVQKCRQNTIYYNNLYK